MLHFSKEENRDYNNGVIRMIQNTFTAHQGIMFVIETNKQLREEIQLLELRLHEANKLAVDMRNERNEVSKKVEILQSTLLECSLDPRVPGMAAKLLDSRKKSNKLVDELAKSRNNYSELMSKYQYLRWRDVKDEQPPLHTPILVIADAPTLEPTVMLVVRNAPSTVDHHGYEFQDRDEGEQKYEYQVKDTEYYDVGADNVTKWAYLPKH